MPVLYVVACGAPPTAYLPTALAELRTDGWTVCVIATPAGLDFLNAESVQQVIDFPVRSMPRKPDQADPFPAANAVLVAPCSFNTLNKWAAGISDTLALGILNELLGTGLPIVVAVWAKEALRRHPAFSHSLDALRSAGVDLVAVGSGPDLFPWEQLRDRLAALSVAPRSSST
jgi:phosphopantothenoylcysteine synthetase/decarboxylase